VGLKIDTGMGRLGFDWTQAGAVVRELASIPSVTISVVASHLANADDTDDPYTGLQVRRFLDATAAMTCPRSLANSAGVAAWPDSHCDWIRPGIMLYGASPLVGRDGSALGLRPVMTLASRLIAVRRLEPGRSVGYGGDWTCSEPTRVGVVACGYGHGYPRHAGSGTPVLVNGCRVPLIGRVSMDMLAVDLQAVEARVGDPVVLWGNGLPVDEIARAAGTIPYELLTKVTRRVPRVVVDDG
jgi:alanine racemase